VRKSYVCLIFLFTAFTASAQWKQVPLNYKYTKHPDFFVPAAMHFSDSANGFILNGGNLMQLKNQQWVPVNTGDPSAFSYTNIFTVNPQNTFLCGWDGKVAKFNGDSLEVLFTLNETEADNLALNTIFMIDSTHGWAAGENGTLVKIDGATHEMANLSAMYGFRDIFFDAPDHGWMIGYEQGHIDDEGVVFEYSQGAWNIHSYIDGQVYDIEFSSPGKGFITSAYDIYAFNSGDNEWQPENIAGYYQQYHLSMLNDAYGISVSDNNQNLVYENGVWQPAPAASVADLVSVKTLDNGAAWAISQIGNNNPQDLNDGKIQLMRQNEWSGYSMKYLDTVSVLPLNIAVTNITTVGKKNIWFDGQYLHVPYDKDWSDTTPLLISDTFCTVLKMFSPNFGLGLNGDLLEWNGQAWANKHIDPFQSPDTSITNICMQVFNDTTGFICRQYFAWSSGEIKNTIEQYDYQTNRLTESTVLDTRQAYAMHFSGKENGWCTGDSGLTARYADSHWEILPPVTTKRLTAVFTVNATMAWAVGDEGTLLKYNGAVWEQQPIPTIQNLHSIYFTDSTHGWLTGDSGLLFRYNGTEWLPDSTGTTEPLYSIYMVDSTYGFAGGENGLILQYVKPTPPAPPVSKFCEFGNSYYVYQPEGTGYTYQWQADTGNGFENLSDDSLFSGTASDTLFINTVPSSFYGYKFRCIATIEGVDSVSNVQELKFINRWIGTVSKQWEDAGNWSCGTIPGENTDVLVEKGDIVLSSAAAIRSLAVLPGVNITIAEGGGLTILK
jgi:photosystem II stability/assembly factor-like uncharacterized protein